MKKYKPYIYHFDEQKYKFSVKDYFSYELFFLKKDKHLEQFLISLIKYLRFKNIIHNIFDIGSNIGFYKVLFSSIKEAKVHSFEPFQDLIKIQNKNLKINSINNVTINQVGITSPRNKNDIYVDKIYSLPSNTLNFLNLSDLSYGKSFDQKVKLISLEEYCTSKSINKVDLIKIDIEGGEYEILYDIKNFINKHKPIIYIEVHSLVDQYYKKYDDTKKNLYPLNCLFNNEYELFLINDKKENLKTNDVNLIYESIFHDKMKYVKISESDSKLISKISNMSNYKIFGYSKNSDFQIEIDKI